MPQPSSMQTGQAPLKFREMREIVTALAMFPALTVMIFLRIPATVGYRKLTSGAIYGTAFLLYVLNAIGNFHMALPLGASFGATEITHSLSVFALIYLVAALCLRKRALDDLRRGRGVATYSHGRSYLEFLPIRKDRVYRIVDPVVAFLAGLTIRRLGYGGLGLWVCFSAMCFRLVEEYVRKKQEDAWLDRLDAEHEAAWLAEGASIYETPEPEFDTPQASGMATGISDQLAADIAARKRRTEAAL